MSPRRYLNEPAAIDLFNAGKKEASIKRFKEPRGRMDELSWGQTLYRYRSGPAEEATRAYAKLAKQHGMSLTELSLRWARQRAAVTTSLLGVSSMAQLEEDLERLETEGVGDCWLLSILAGFEVKDPKLVAGLDTKQRKEICTSRREDIVSWAADWKRNGGFRFLCDQLGITISGDNEAAKEKASQEVRVRETSSTPHDGAHEGERDLV